LIIKSCPQLLGELSAVTASVQVCTLADLDYDVYHATIKSCDGMATQEYYVRPRYGFPWDAQRAKKLGAMLEASIQRRFPRGLKVHVQSVDSFGCLAALTAVLRDAGLTITRAKVLLLSLLLSRCRPALLASLYAVILLPHLRTTEHSLHKKDFGCTILSGR